MAIYLAPTLLSGSSGISAEPKRAALRQLPEWFGIPCSRRGLPFPLVTKQDCGLLLYPPKRLIPRVGGPTRFTLTPPCGGAVSFLWHFPWASSTWAAMPFRYDKASILPKADVLPVAVSNRLCSMLSGLSSPPLAGQPSDSLTDIIVLQSSYFCKPKAASIAKLT